MDPLTTLTEFYEKELRVNLREATAGRKYRIYDNPKEAFGCGKKEEFLAREAGVEGKRLFELRRQAIGPFFYDALVAAENALQEQTLEDDGLAELLKKVDVPIVERAHRMLRQNGGIDQTSRQTFYSWLNEAEGPITLNILMNAITTLNVAAEHPDVIENIDSDYQLSASGIHRLFSPHKKVSGKVLGQEITEAIWPVFPEGTPDHLIEAFGRIGEFIESIGKGSINFKNRRKGDYILVPELHLDWSPKLHDDIGAELDNLYRPNEETEVAVKRLAYATLYSCLRGISTVVYRPKGKNLTLPQKSPFSLAPTNYAILRDMARDFAINQLVHAWNNTRDIGDDYTLPTTSLAGRMGITARGGPLGIKVKYRAAEFQFSRPSVNQDSSYLRTTTANLPTAIFYVNQFYQGAKKIMEPATKK